MGTCLQGCPLPLQPPGSQPRCRRRIPTWRSLPHGRLNREGLLCCVYCCVLYGTLLYSTLLLCCVLCRQMSVLYCALQANVCTVPYCAGTRLYCTVLYLAGTRLYFTMAYGLECDVAGVSENFTKVVGHMFGLY